MSDFDVGPWFWFGVALFEALRPLTGEPSLAPEIAASYGYVLCPGDSLEIEGVGSLTYG